MILLHRRHIFALSLLIIPCTTRPMLRAAARITAAKLHTYAACRSFATKPEIFIDSIEHLKTERETTQAIHEEARTNPLLVMRALLGSDPAYDLETIERLKEMTAHSERKAPFLHELARLVENKTDLRHHALIPFWQKSTREFSADMCRKAVELKSPEAVLMIHNYSSEGLTQCPEAVADAAESEELLPMLKILLKLGAPVNGCLTMRTTPLMNAIYKGNNAAAILLLQNNANPNRGNGYELPLEAATKGDNPEMVRVLLRYNARPTYSLFGVSALDIARRNFKKNNPILEMLERAAKKQAGY